MNRVRVSITSVCLASFVAACSSSSTPQGGTGGNSVTDTGGSGSGGNANGGSSGNVSGGSSGSGSDSGGNSGSDSGGSQAGGSQTQGGASGNGGKTGTNGGAPAVGGSQSGGSQGTGGSAPGTGGTTVAELKLVTSSSSSYWKTDGSWTEVSSGTADVTVNDSSASQTWEGFGGCFNEMGWAQLSTTALQTEAMNLLFGTDGCNFAMGRIPIGASDYAMSRYTLDETANDTSMASFSISRDEEKLIPYIKAALAVKSNIRLWASPWTPPTWMKSGQKSGTVPSAFDGGNMKTDETTLKAHAQYFVKFIQEYAKKNLTIEAVAPQNEPNYEQNYPSCLWDKATYTSFVGKYLGPALTSASLTTKIMLGTMSNPDSGEDPDIVTAVMGDSTAKSYIASIGVQWGMVDKASGYKSYNLPIWVSEHKCGNYPWTTSTYKTTAPNDIAYAVESWGLIRDAIKAGVTAYNAWNMVLDNVGKGIDTTRDWAQNSLLTVSGGKITQTPTYHVFRHFSQFADPGAKVVATTGGDAIAFKNPDNSIVVVMYNKDSAKTYIVSVGGKKLSFSMPAAGWATINYNP
jgi:glucosylceramidase